MNFVKSRNTLNRATEEPLRATEEPLGATEEPLGATEEPLGATEEPLGATEELLRVKCARYETTEIFLFKECPVDFINRIRRIAIRDIPTCALEPVTIIVNESNMDDEVLAHRLAMINFKVVKIKEFLIKNQMLATTLPICLDENFEVKFQGQGTTTRQNLSIRNLFQPSEYVDLNLEPTADVLITPIAPGQRIVATGRLRIGTMKEHAKWQTCWAYLQHFKYNQLLTQFQPIPDIIQELIQRAYQHYLTLINQLETPLLQRKFARENRYCYDQTCLYIETFSEYTPREILICSLYKFCQQSHLDISI